MPASGILIFFFSFLIFSSILRVHGMMSGDRTEVVIWIARAEVGKLRSGL